MGPRTHAMMRVLHVPAADEQQTKKKELCLRPREVPKGDQAKRAATCCVMRVWGGSVYVLPWARHHVSCAACARGLQARVAFPL